MQAPLVDTRRPTRRTLRVVILDILPNALFTEVVVTWPTTRIGESLQADRALALLHEIGKSHLTGLGLRVHSWVLYVDSLSTKCSTVLGASSPSRSPVTLCCPCYPDPDMVESGAGILSFPEINMPANLDFGSVCHKSSIPAPPNNTPPSIDRRLSGSFGANQVIKPDSRPMARAVVLFISPMAMSAGCSSRTCPDANLECLFHGVCGSPPPPESATGSIPPPRSQAPLSNMDAGSAAATFVILGLALTPMFIRMARGSKKYEGKHVLVTGGSQG